MKGYGTHRVIGGNDIKWNCRRRTRKVQKAGIRAAKKRARREGVEHARKVS